MAPKKVNEAKPKEALEFGGPVGASVLMIWSHYIVTYFWCLSSFFQYLNFLGKFFMH